MLLFDFDQPGYKVPLTFIICLELILEATAITIITTITITTRTVT